MRPPKTAMARTRDIVHRVRIRVMIPVVRDPRARRTRAVKNRTKNQKLLNYGIEFDCAMRQVPVKTDRRSKTAKRCYSKCAEEDFPAGQRKKYQSDHSQNM